jgi:cell division protease FtsH
MIFGKDSVTTGASNDIMRATQIARHMVTKWGLSEKLGPLMYEEEENNSLMGSSRNANVSDEVSREIDDEIRHFIDSNYARSQTLLEENSDVLHAMADALMKYETIDSAQIEKLMARQDPGEPKDWQERSSDSDGDAPEAVEPSDEAETDKTRTDLSDESSDDVSGKGEPSLH